MILGFSDYAAGGTVTCSQSFASSAPLVNLQARRLGKRARSTAAADSTFRLTVDLGQSRFLPLVGLLSPDPLLMPEDAPFPVPVATARVELSNVSASGSEVWSGYTTGTRHALCIPGAGIAQTALSARWVSFVFRSVAANWSCGRLWAGLAFWPVNGMDYNYTAGVIDSGTTRTLRGGANNPRPGVILDTISAQCSSLQLSEAIGPGPEGLADIKTMLRVVGNTGEVLMVPRGLGRVSPAGWIEQNAWQLDQLAVYGRLTGDLAGAIQHGDSDNYTTSLTVVEER
jgi:hypothetical protein